MIERAGTELVNWHLLVEDGRVTIVDAGCPTYRPQLDDALRRVGCRIEDVEAIVLTHAHVDHVGFSAVLQDERGIPVYAHEAELPQATTGKSHDTEGSIPSMLLSNRRARRVVLHMARNGATHPPKVARVVSFSDGDELDLPGHPRAIHTPGHSPGHCALHVPAEGAMLVGDALSGWDPITGKDGPSLPPRQLSQSMAVARASLARIEEIAAQSLFFGHGDPWTGGAAQAVAEARERDRRG